MIPHVYHGKYYLRLPKSSSSNLQIPIILMISSKVHMVLIASSVYLLGSNAADCLNDQIIDGTGPTKDQVATALTQYNAISNICCKIIYTPF